MENLLTYFGYILYGVLGMVALWGAFCVTLVWRRVGQTRFRSEDDQVEFLEELEGFLSKGDVNGAIEHCEDDRRAMPQLALLALSNRELGYAKVRQLVADRFQRDVLSDLEHRLSWVYTTIKSAPMVGLLGTVVGMMGAFLNLSTAETVKADQMAGDIMVALITTALGLAIAIPLVFAAASVSLKIRQMEELVGAGMTQFMETLKAMLGGGSPKK
ncbi:MAG: MotA/TolQ/ExbB proton channel family protein [Planctomycetales bacterium]|nr:MotA/TolQ/ExbB proton channel family protein [Planctomycetales bacterium]